MTPELRKTGIDIMGDMPWGTHLCHFHETKQDLLDTSVPYFKAGLEDNEFCLWVISRLLTQEDAQSALRHAVPDLDRYLAEQRIEILPHDEWYLKNGVFDFRRVTNGWHEKLDQALVRDYAGMRVLGCTAWLEKKDWKDFREYETELNASIANRSMIVLCAYQLTASGAADVLDVARTHQFTVARRKGNWEVIESPELKQAKAEIKRLSEELEQRVVERTRELTATSEALGRELIEHKRAEAALYQERTFVSAILDTADALIVVTDARGRIVRFNRACERLTGYAFDDVQNQYMWDLTFLPEEMKLVTKAFWAQPPADQFPSPSENDWVTKDGRRRLISWSNTALSNAHGQPEYFVGIGIDVTEQRRAEEVLQRRERELRTLADNVPDVIVRFDRHLRRLYANRHLERQRGVPAPPLLGKTDRELGVSEELVVLREEGLHRVFVSGRADTVEFTLPLVDGKKYLESRLVPELAEDGTVETVLTLTRDITARKRAEEGLRTANEQLRALSASLRSAREEEGARIARELHDELGSALTSMRWDLEGTEKFCAEADKQTDFSPLRQKVKDMLELIDATLTTVKRLSAELRPAILDDLGLVAAIEWQAQQFAARAGIPCQVDAVVDTLELSREQVTAVFRICQEALTNILRHAQATRVSIMVEEGAKELILEVKDNGRGITEAERTGLRSLGLIGMRERAQLVGGRIEITGVAGQGTVLIVRVPVAGQAEKEPR